jgi:hypothetical protein
MFRPFIGNTIFNRVFGGLFKSLCSFLFDGVDEAFNIDEALPSLETTTKGGWLGTFYIPDATPLADEYMVCFNDSTQATGLVIYLDGTSGKFVAHNRLSAVFQWRLETDAQAFLDNSWNTVALVQNAVSPILYINGVAVAQTLTISTNTTRWLSYLTLDNGRIGARNYASLGDSNFFNGYANYVALLDNNLSSAQVLDWHNGGLPKSAKTLFPNDCVYEWIPQDAYPFDSVNNEWAVANSVSVPTVPKSFDMDGINNEFAVNIQDLESLISGSNKTFTFGFVFKRSSLGAQQMIFANLLLDSIYLYWTSTNLLEFRIKDATVTKSLRAIGDTFAETDEWYCAIVTYDPTQALGSRGQMYVNNIQLTITTDTLTTNIDTPTSEYLIGQRGGVNYLDGNLNQLFILDRLPTSQERTDWYDNGNPKSPIDIFGTDCKYFFNPNNLYTFDSINTQWGVPNSANLPTIYKSFELDGVDENFTIPKADLQGVLSGSNKTFTLGFVAKRGAIGYNTILASWTSSLLLRFNNTDTLQFRFADATITKSLETVATYTDLNQWLSVIITYDYSQSLGSRGKIYVNNVDEPIGTDTLTTDIDTPTADYLIGTQLISRYFNGDLNQIFVLDRIPTSQERTDWYDNGNPKSPIDIFGTDCKYFFNPNNLYAFDSVNTQWGVPNSANLPTIYKSFEFDGVAEYFSIPNANLVGTLMGANKQFSVDFMVKVATIGVTNKGVLGAGTSGSNNWNIRFNSSDRLELITYDGAVTKTLQCAPIVFDVNDWLFFTVSYDSTQSLGNRGEIFLNGVTQAKASDTLTDNIDVRGEDFGLFAQRLALNEWDGTTNFLSIRDTPTTLAEHQALYNNGNPLSSQTVWGANNVYTFNPLDAVYSGGYTVTDAINSITATGVNVDEADLKYEAPQVTISTNVDEADLKYEAPQVTISTNVDEVDLKYRAPQVSYSVNMEEADKDCTQNPY